LLWKYRLTGWRSFWPWLGLTAARIAVHDLFENRPNRLTLLTIGHELVTLLAMALIIGLLKPKPLLSGLRRLCLDFHRQIRIL
jgi:hypothetical protein